MRHMITSARPGGVRVGAVQDYAGEIAGQMHLLLARTRLCESEPEGQMAGMTYAAKPGRVSACQ